jgi:hypothetical protein
VALLCRHLGVSRSGYYAWAKRPESERDKSERALSVEVAAVHQESRSRYGSQAMTSAGLHSLEGFPAGGAYMSVEALGTNAAWL